MARLAEIPGIEDAATDHSGTLLSLRARDTSAVAAVRSALSALGYETAVLPVEEERARLSSAMEWYDAARVQELSREEAVTLAEETTSAFARESTLTAAERERLRSDAEEELFKSFTVEAHAPVRLAERAFPGIVERASAYLGEERAARLESALRAWSEARHRT